MIIHWVLFHFIIERMAENMENKLQFDYHYGQEAEQYMSMGLKSGLYKTIQLNQNELDIKFGQRLINAGHHYAYELFAFDLFKCFSLLFDADFSGKSLNAGSAKEAVHAFCVFDDIPGVFRFGDGAAMADYHDIRVDRPARIAYFLHAFDAIIQCQCSLCANAAFGGETHMCDQNIGARFGHCLCLIYIKYIWSGKQIHFMGFADHINLQAIPHICFLKILAEHTINESYGWEVLYTDKSHILELAKEYIHNPERIGTAYASQHRCVLHNRKNLAAHINNDLIGIAIGKQTGQGAAPCHSVPAGVVND